MDVVTVIVAARQPDRPGARKPIVVCIAPPQGIGTCPQGRHVGANRCVSRVKEGLDRWLRRAAQPEARLAATLQGLVAGVADRADAAVQRKGQVGEVAAQRAPRRGPLDLEHTHHGVMVAEVAIERIACEPRGGRQRVQQGL